MSKNTIRDRIMEKYIEVSDFDGINDSNFIGEKILDNYKYFVFYDSDKDTTTYLSIELNHPRYRMPNFGKYECDIQKSFILAPTERKNGLSFYITFSGSDEEMEMTCNYFNEINKIVLDHRLKNTGLEYNIKRTIAIKNIPWEYNDGCDFKNYILSFESDADAATFKMFFIKYLYKPEREYD